MASRQRVYTKEKLLGQVYTPQHIVDRILSLTGFYTTDFSNKKLLDPACGDGRFLIRVVAHIAANHPPHVSRQLLENVHGWDIDANAIQACRENLDAVVAPYGIQMTWNLRCTDALKQHRSRGRFDYIIGNPPYIRIQHLSQAQRTFIRKNFAFCASGSTDAYIAFFELVTKLLAKNGKCGFITPNSFLISDTGEPLRAYFERRQNLMHLTNYGVVPVFGNTGTYAAVTIFGNEPQHAFRFETCADDQFQYIGREIQFAEIEPGRPWHLSVQLPETSIGKRLGDICRISVGITTLSDWLFLFSIIEEKGDLVLAKNKNGLMVWLEKAMLRPIIKGSKLKTSADAVTEHILFPYQQDAALKHRIIPEETLKTQFPESFSYLLKVKPELDRRDNGKPNAVAWYAFGRAQGLDSSFGKKIIFSPMNRFPNFVLYENPDVTVYSGYYIKFDGDYQRLLAELNSVRMAAFMSVAGRDFQGGYKGYNKKAIENFIVTGSF